MYKEIEKRLSIDEHELFSILGSELVELEERSNNGTVFDSKESSSFGDIGRKFWESRVQDIENKLCFEWEACKKIENYEQGGDSEKLATTVAELLSTIVTGLPLATLTSIVIKRGLRNICAC